MNLTMDNNFMVSGMIVVILYMLLSVYPSRD